MVDSTYSESCDERMSMAGNPQDSNLESSNASFDEKPVDVAIALLVPDGEAGTTHIKLLSKTAVLLMRDEFKSLLRGSNDQEVIAQAINEGISEE